MNSVANVYEHNPMIHRDRRLARAASSWARSFACEDMKILIVCRGPIRKEAIDVFREMGVAKVGILLSDKDSIVYTLALAPEVRDLDPSVVHRVRDYSGANKDERTQRVQEIIQICRGHGYEYVFAGYGFMAEDEDFVRALEDAGIKFVGPCSFTQRAAGKKDEAKKTALEQHVSVTPGVNDATVRTLLARYPNRSELQALSKEKQLGLDALFEDSSVSLTALAEKVLDASYQLRLDLFPIEALAAQIQKDVLGLFHAHPGRRIRLKAIGGGGGKGQRILDQQPTAEAAVERVPEKVREVLAEVKAGGVGDNKNMLLELNVEQTRHLEIQMVGNGEWCVTLGGRDCSLQMHEQKLLEISVCRESAEEAMALARAARRDSEAEALNMELVTLERMEAEAERFGRAVKLDSCSTFECIVDGPNHYFMEVNTRIQVEHRVSELCYKLRFSNPADATDFFEVESLVEAMALIARHKQRLPRPTRQRRYGAAAEARLNATDRALQPHAGGIIQNWSRPIEGEIRDDQGISRLNPDTELFMRYRVAGAYDSNVALLVTADTDRWTSYQRLAEILRVTKLRGQDLCTNLEFHYGLIHWFIGRNVYAKPTTRFVAAYLALVGLLREEAQEVDLALATKELQARYEKRYAGQKEALAAIREVFTRKQTLVGRVLEKLLDEPHVLSGWLSAHRGHFEMHQGKVRWLVNPLQVLRETYHFLNMDYRRDWPAAQVIWAHDDLLLQEGLAFYDALKAQLGTSDWLELQALLEGAPQGLDPARWSAVVGAHHGHQAGLELLSLLPQLAHRCGFWELDVQPDMTVRIPERLLDPQLYARTKKILVPPPPNKADEIVSVSGGMCYLREAPDRPLMVKEGDHFEAGQPLYIIEVMKMFNRVVAPFAGRVDKVVVEGDGVIVSKGQPIFKVTPDEKVLVEDPKVREKRRKERTLALFEGIG